MEDKYIKELTESLERSLHNLKVLTDAGIPVTEAMVQEQAQIVAETSNKLTNLIEDKELNEVGNSIGDVSEYVDNKSVDVHINETIDNLKSKAQPKDSKPPSVEDTVDLVISDLGFSSDAETYKKTFKSHLIKAIERVGSSRCYSKFFVSPSGDPSEDPLEGTLKPKDGNVLIEIHGGSYLALLNPTGWHEEEEESKEDTELTFYEDEEEEQYQCACDGNPHHVCTGCEDEHNILSVEDMDVEDLYSYAVKHDEWYFTEVEGIRNRIFNLLAGKELRNAKELELVRYYLRHGDGNTEDVESMRDRTLKLAWRFINYKKNNM